MVGTLLRLQLQRDRPARRAGVWEEGDAQVTFCLEYDRSTETLERLEKKLEGYEDLQIASGYAYWVLFRFGHRRREAGARQTLAEATVPVATAAPGPTRRPHDAMWAPIGHDGCRMRLAEPAGVPYPPESYRRIEETQEHRRRIDEQRRRDYPDRYGEA
jgi:hypothetical protein